MTHFNHKSSVIGLKFEPIYLVEDPYLNQIQTKEQKMKQNWSNLYNDGLLPYSERTKMFDRVRHFGARSKIAPMWRVNPMWRVWRG